MSDIEKWKKDVGPGWSFILDLTDNALEQWIPGYKIRQIKEKFGGLRYYFDFPDNFDDDYDLEDPATENEYSVRKQSIWDFVHAMESLASTVCDQCGKPGQMRTSGPYNNYVLCDEHKDGG